jgi:hypothetical protein
MKPSPASFPECNIFGAGIQVKAGRDDKAGAICPEFRATPPCQAHVYECQGFEQNVKPQTAKSLALAFRLCIIENSQ